jgi:hypothetical protein
MSFHSSAASAALPSPESFSASERSATSRTSHSARRSSKRESPTVAWTPLPSSGTSELSSAKDGLNATAAEWISSLEASPARPCRALESGPLRPTNDGSGPIRRSAFAELLPDGSFSKTSGAYFLPGMEALSGTFSETWPRSGMWALGTVFELPTWARRTGGNGCSSWPTAKTPTGGPNPHGRDGHQNGGMDLQASASTWATPGANNGAEIPALRPSRIESGRTTEYLGRQVAMWPSPAANLHNYDEDPESFEARRERLKQKGINGNGAGLPLGQAAQLWPTPNVPNGGRKPTDAKLEELVANKGRTALGKRQVGLENVAQLWPTPRADIGPGFADNGRGGRSLDVDARQRSTPSVNDSKNNAAPSQQTRNSAALNVQASSLPALPTETPGAESLPSGQTSLRLYQTPRVGPHGPAGQGARHEGQPKGMRLNPRFVGWLMNFPIGWTEPFPLERDSFVVWEMQSFRLLERLLSSYFQRD